MIINWYMFLGKSDATSAIYHELSWVFKGYHELWWVIGYHELSRMIMTYHENY